MRLMEPLPTVKNIMTVLLRKTKKLHIVACFNITKRSASN